MPYCDTCGTDEYVDYAVLSDGNLTCHNCGKVIDDSQNYRNEVDLVNTGGRARACGSIVSLTSDGITACTSVPRNNSIHRRSEVNPVQKWIDIIGSKMNVGESMLSQMHHMHVSITTRKNEDDPTPEKYTRSPDVFAAAIVYLVLRQNSKPFTLLDLSQVIQKNVFLVGRVADLIVRRNQMKLNEVHPSIYVDKVCKEITHVNPSVLATIKTYANQIINTIKPHWVHTGKRLDAVCVAAIYIAAEAAGSFSSCKDLCQAIKAGEGTAKSRVREIKKELMQLTAPKLPWMREIKIKDMHKYLGKMLSQLETMTRLAEAKNAPRPPPQGDQNLNGHETFTFTAPKVVSSPESPPCTQSPSTSAPSSQPRNPTTSPGITPPFAPIPTTYLDKKPDLYQNPLPPAFLSSVNERLRRQHKLDNAKRRLRELFEKDPALAEYCSPALRASVYSMPPIDIPPPPPLPPAPFSLSTKTYPVAPAYKKRSPPATPSPTSLPTTPSPTTPPPTTPSPTTSSPTASSPTASSPTASSPTASSPTASSPASSPTVSSPTAPSPTSPTPTQPTQSPPSSPSHSPLPASASTGKTFATLAHADAMPAMPPTPVTPVLSARRRRSKNDPAPKKEKPPLLAMPSLDHEDLIIEKLLMKGMSEDQILDGYYFTEQLAEIKHPSFHSEAVGEDDIPEFEMNRFIRTQEEVDILTKFEEEGEEEGESKKKEKKKKPSGSSGKKRSKSGKGKKKEEEIEDWGEGEREGERQSEHENVLDSEAETTGEETLQVSRKKTRATTE